VSGRRRLVLAAGIVGAYLLALLQPWLLQPGTGLAPLAALLGAGSLVLAAALVRPTPVAVRLARWVALLLVLVCAASFLFAAAVVYAVVAIAAVPARPVPAAPPTPDTPHEFSPLSARWQSNLLPLGWAGGPLGAFQRGAVRCRFCGRGVEDAVHVSPPDVAGAPPPPGPGPAAR